MKGQSDMNEVKNASLALFHACKAYRGPHGVGTGISAVARLIGRDPDVLQKKLSPTCDTHHLTLDEAEAISEITGIQAGAIELARAAGLACIPLPNMNIDGGLVKGMSDIGREFSELLNEFNLAMLDNLVTPSECDRFHRESIQLFVACMAELGRMRALAATRAPIMPLREVTK
jgi:hypothetical protein